MKLEIIEFDIPAFLICAIINNDYTALNDQEIQQLDRFLADNNNGYFILSDDLESYFIKYHDLSYTGFLAADCMKLNFVILEEK